MAVDREFAHIYWVQLGPNFIELGSNWFQIGSNWAPILLHLDPFGSHWPLWDPLGVRPGLATSRALQSATGAQLLRFWNSPRERRQGAKGPLDQTKTTQHTLLSQALVVPRQLSRLNKPIVDIIVWKTETSQTSRQNSAPRIPELTIFI